MDKQVRQELVDFINKQQTEGSYHPHKCNCEDKKVLMANRNCIECPCGNYKLQYRRNEKP